MYFSYSIEKVVKLQKELTSFMEEHIYPNERLYEQQLK